MKTIIFASLVFITLSAVSRAERHAEQFGGEVHVVHTRRAPVVMHRAVPPYKGVHVYQGRR
jgi:hypothetical protein